MIAAISSQSTASPPDVSRHTPIQSPKTPEALGVGAKKRSGSLVTSSSRTPSGAGHHMDIRSSLEKSESWNRQMGFLSDMKKQGAPALRRSVTWGSARAILRTRSSACNAMLTSLAQPSSGDERNLVPGDSGDRRYVLSSCPSARRSWSVLVVAETYDPVRVAFIVHGTPADQRWLGLKYGIDALAGDAAGLADDVVRHAQLHCNCGKELQLAE